MLHVIFVPTKNYSSYTPAPTDEKLFMANSVVTKMEGTGKVLLKMTSG